MRIMIVSAVCNVALDYLFIMVLRWGVSGAAWPP
jgi:Na+-driven multidrug efflux pump